MVRRARPVRTCVGCRKRSPSSELLRIVAVRDEVDHFSLVPDPARRLPGRGAYLHNDPDCLVLAQRRRVFGRALRVSGMIDIGPLARAFEEAATLRMADDGQR